jgi:PAS domain S-box-containing protein
MCHPDRSAAQWKDLLFFVSVGADAVLRNDVGNFQDTSLLRPGCILWFRKGRTLTEPLQVVEQNQPLPGMTSPSPEDPLAPMSDETSSETSDRSLSHRADETSALLAAIVESSDDAIISCTLDGSITSWNKGAERIFGYSSAEMMGRPTSVLGSQSAKEDPAIVLERIRQGQHIEHYETYRRHKDGSDIIVSLSVSPVRNSAGQIIGASKVARDITSMRRAEQALRNADKLALAGRMAASIAHEINNPLEAITNLLYLLEQESLSGQGRRYLDLAEHELMRASNITSQTLGFFRGTAAPTLSQLSDIVASAISLHAGRLTIINVNVETNYLSVAPLLCDQGEIRQVLVNLVSNALDAMTSQGRLLVRIRPATDTITGASGIRLTIADTGSGMNAKTLGRMFEPFYTTKGATGTGLGLWVTQQIVARHKGRISIRSSQSPARHGTIFCLFFPYTDQAVQDQTAQGQPTVSSASDPTLSVPAGDDDQATSREDACHHRPSEPDQPSTERNAA